MKPLTREWLAKAEGDYKVAVLLIKTKQPVFDAICYHAQQCVEKYLKAWLSEQSIHIPKIHDLEALLKSCQPSLPRLIDDLDDARYLNAFAIEIRYPGSVAGDVEAKKSLEIARKFRRNFRKEFRSHKTS